MKNFIFIISIILIILTLYVIMHRASQMNFPLILSEKGSFYVGGENVVQNFVELGSKREADTVTINQMYVEYMVPYLKKNTPVILVHGAGMSGACYDTTPDGRMGWFEYFVRKSFPVYVVDQVGRARSGFNQAIYNNVAEGIVKPSQQPRISRMGDLHAAWINFRIGPKKDVAFSDTQYPVEYVSELSKMSISDLSDSLQTPNPNYKTLSHLAKQINGAVLIGHSQAGHFPLETALLEPDYVKGMVLLEPGTCEPEKFNDSEISKLANIPLLVVYGDHLEGSIEIPNSTDSWQKRFDGCTKLIDRINASGGNAIMFYLPDKGMKGNTHMFMQDKNNLDVADLIIKWIKEYSR